MVCQVHHKIVVLQFQGAAKPSMFFSPQRYSVKVSLEWIVYTFFLYSIFCPLILAISLDTDNFGLIFYAAFYWIAHIPVLSTCVASICKTLWTLVFTPLGCLLWLVSLLSTKAFIFDIPCYTVAPSLYTRLVFALDTSINDSWHLFGNSVLFTFFIFPPYNDFLASLLLCNSVETLPSKY